VGLGEAILPRKDSDHAEDEAGTSRNPSLAARAASLALSRSPCVDLRLAGATPRGSNANPSVPGPSAAVAVKFCGQCGAPSSQANRFCVSCGAAVAAIQPDIAESELAPRLRAAVERLAQRDPASALAILDPLCKESPDNAIARAYRGIAYLRLTRVADARDELDAAVQLAPESFICQAKRAEFLAQLGFYDQAVAQLDVATRLTPPDAASLHAALELRNFSREKAKGIYYRPLVYPKFPRISLRAPFRRKALPLRGEI